MATEAIDDAMLVIQQASTAIEKVSHQLSGVDGQNRAVVEALKELTNRVGNLEEAATSKTSTKNSRLAIKPSCYTKVS